MVIQISDQIAAWKSSVFGHLNLQPWEVTNRLSELVDGAISKLSEDYVLQGNIAIHRTAIIETSTSINGPVIIGPNAYIGAGALLRGGVFLDSGCVVGHACEVKSSILFADSKVAHLSFIGDSIIGARVNIEAGAIIANYRNELQDKRIRFVWQNQTVETNVEKFGALVGDEVRIGANAVVAPGAILEARSTVDRLQNFDLYPVN